MQKKFENWLTTTRKKMNRPDKYSGIINSISNKLKENHINNWNLYNIYDIEQLEYLWDFYFKKYGITNETGNKEYSTGFNHYLKFIGENFKNAEFELNKIKKDPELSTTDKETLYLSRKGQGKYRKGLIDLWKACSISGYKQISILIASHIKPWIISNNIERVDPYNGFLLLPNYDKLFDKGLITFDSNGKIKISNKFIENDKDLEILGINENSLIKVFKENIKYLEFHQNYVFEKKPIKSEI